eukprot:COSAG06_NODE_4265_length_4419_cov_9.045139_6_plen_83_part_00
MIVFIYKWRKNAVFRRYPPGDSDQEEEEEEEEEEQGQEQQGQGQGQGQAAMAGGGDPPPLAKGAKNGISFWVFPMFVPSLSW